MRFSLFSVAIRNLKRKSIRTLVLVFSIGLLVSILVFGTSFIISVSSSIERASGRLGADVLVVPAGAVDFAQEVLLEAKSETFYMDKGLVEKVRQFDEIEKVTYQTYLTSILGICCDIPAAKIVAFNQDTDFIIKPWMDRILKRRLEKGEAIIGYDAYDNLGLYDVESSVLFNMKFDFVGVLEKTGTGLDNAIFISEENVESILNRSDIGIDNTQISIIFTKIREGLDPEKVGRKIESTLLEVDVIPRNDIGHRIIKTLRDINTVFMITIILASVLSAFLAWSVFSAIANERVKEIGIMRAIGAKCSHVFWMFVLEVLLLGLAGSILGIVMGTYMSVSLNKTFELLQDLSATLTVVQRMEIGAMGLIVGTGICLVGALSSIIRLRKLDPLKALKEI